MPESELIQHKSNQPTCSKPLTHQPPRYSLGAGVGGGWCLTEEERGWEPGQGLVQIQALQLASCVALNKWLKLASVSSSVERYSTTSLDGSGSKKKGQWGRGGQQLAQLVSDKARIPQYTLKTILLSYLPAELCPTRSTWWDADLYQVREKRWLPSQWTNVIYTWEQV